MHLLHYHLQTFLQHASLLSSPSCFRLGSHRPPLRILCTSNRILCHPLRLLCLATSLKQTFAAGLQARQLLSVSLLQLAHLPLQFPSPPHQFPGSACQHTFFLALGLQLMEGVLEEVIVGLKVSELLLATVDNGTSLLQFLP